jgi:uncharacterized membrane protein YtjA (UPF0391 family)
LPAIPSVFSYKGSGRRLAEIGGQGSYIGAIATAVVAPNPEPDMLHYAVVFFIIALIAAVLGFGGLAAGAASIGKVLFVIFIVMALVTIVADLVRKR